MVKVSLTNGEMTFQKKEECKEREREELDDKIRKRKILKNGKKKSEKWQEKI